MKKNILFLMMFFFCIACTEDESVDTTVMPLATTTGEHTFGCLVDGWLCVGGRYHPLSLWELSVEESIHFKYYQEADEVVVSVRVKPGQDLCFKIIAPREGQTVVYTDAFLVEEGLGDGTVTITRFDRERRIISGKFEGGRVTHGRFDVRYTTWESENW